MTEPIKEQTKVDFENPLVKTLLAKQLKIREEDLRYFVLPYPGDTITLGNVIYRISYVRSNPFRFTAEPVGILKDKEMEKLLTQKKDPNAITPN